MPIFHFILEQYYQPYFICFLSIIACVFYYYLRNEAQSYRTIIWLAYSLLFVGVIVVFIKGEIYRINQPKVWDITALYLYGKTALLGYNFYLPENFHQVFNSLNIPFQTSDLTEFKEAVLDVGFPYPPPTMLYFLPLGFLSYKAALVVWSLFILIFLCCNIFFAFEQFFKADKLNGFMLVTILFLIYPSVNSTLYFSQTNFIVLFYLLLMKRFSDHKYAGIFLTLAFFTKPFMLIFGLYFLISKNWKAIAYFLVSATILSGISIILFGGDTFMSYFINNTTQRLPGWVFSEDINQSLHAVLLRLNLIKLDEPQIYLIISASLIGITFIYSIYLIRRKLNDYVWVLLLLIGILVYPGTLSHYGVVLIFIMVQFFNNKKLLGLSPFIVIPIIGLLYYFDSISIFASICFLLIIVMVRSLWQIKQLNLSSALN
jgi:hypothetical protein